MAAGINTFVVDASFILAGLFPDELSPGSDTVIEKYLDKEIELISSNNGLPEQTSLLLLS